MPRTVTVVVDMYEDEDGLAVILPNEKELRSRDEAADAALKTAQQSIEDAGDVPDDALKILQLTLKAAKARISFNATFRQHVADLRAKAARHTFVLKIPSYGRWEEAVGEHTAPDRNGAVETDFDVAIEHLFRESVDGMSVGEVLDLDRPLAMHLKQRFTEALMPDESLIPTMRL